MSNLKDTLTTVMAVITVVVTAVQAYLQSNTGEINYFQLAIQVAVAIGLYFVGKNADGTTKTAGQIAAQKEASK